MTHISTGELARKLNISNRTLRYYDQIGLVVPSNKNEFGKRFYSEEDILEIEKILLLKSLSLSLEDSKKILAEKSIHSILTAQRIALTEEKETIEQSIHQTISLLHTLELEGQIDWRSLLRLVAPQEKKRRWEDYFSEEENTLLQAQLPKLEKEDLLTRKWINFLKRVELSIQSGEAPQSDTVQLMIDDMEILSAETFDGNRDLMNKFWEVRKSPEASKELGLYPIDETIIQYLEKAMQVKK